MHKLVILVETPQDEDAFNDEWPLFLFLAERMPGLRRESTSHVDTMLFGSLSYSLIHELYFDSLDALKAAMKSQEGRLAGSQIQKMTRGRVALLVADHQEDSLEHIQQFTESAATTGAEAAAPAPPDQPYQEPAPSSDLPVPEPPGEDAVSIPAAPFEEPHQEPVPPEDLAAPEMLGEAAASPGEDAASIPAGPPAESPQEPAPPGELPAREEPQDGAGSHG